VVTHSSGNHGQALAYAANLLGVQAAVVMPRDSSAVKIAAVKGYGGDVVLCEPSMASRESVVEELVRDGGRLVHPFNDRAVIAGQGTVGLEILEDYPEVEAVIVPIGGGGLISGVAIATLGLKPSVKVFGAEPMVADDAFRSKQCGKLVSNESTPETIADGLKANLGTMTWPQVRDLVDEVIRVSEDEIKNAMQFILERAKLVVEPSSATALAAAISPQFTSRGFKRVAIVLTGGNVALSHLKNLF